MGTDCRISMIGTIILEAKGFLAAVIPIRMETTNDNPNAQTSYKQKMQNQLLSL